jgi:hypothetical protein
MEKIAKKRFLHVEDNKERNNVSLQVATLVETDCT